MPGNSSDPIQTRELSTNKLIVGVGQTPITTQTTVGDPAAMAGLTSSQTADQGATQNTGWGADTEAHFDEILTVLNQLQVDVAAAKTAIDGNNTAIDLIIVRLKAFGLIA